MNKQELIERIKRLDESYLKAEFFLKLIEQLDEPEKVTIPQFVADWIKECKEKGDLSLGGAIQLPCPEIYEWLMAWGNQETFARAWLDGYEVENEKRYLVKMPNANFGGNIQILSFKKNSFFWASNWEDYKMHHTRKELEEAGFGWVFDCEGVEIEEVE